jgi:hypothetical protein
MVSEVKVMPGSDVFEIPRVTTSPKKLVVPILKPTNAAEALFAIPAVSRQAAKARPKIFFIVLLSQNVQTLVNRNCDLLPPGPRCQ